MNDHANQQVMRFLEEAGPATRAQVVVATELDGNVVNAALSNLRAKGKIDVEGHGRGAKWFAVLPAAA